MRIGLDIMGGDFAPQETVKGAILAQKELSPNEKLVLIGDESKILEQLKKENADPNLFEIIHAEETIEMGENPAKAFAAKPKSSIAIGFGLLQSNKIDGFASAGNTGAMLVGTMYTIKSIPKVIRPCISSEMPQFGDKKTILLDVGINPDCRPEILYQYGTIGALYMREMFGIENPKVALLNIGAEDAKGNILVKSTFELMKDNKDFNFIGNVEANEIFGNCPADVVVCDGFTGNVVLKEAEGLYAIFKKQSPKNEFLKGFDFEYIGGTPILGVNSTVIIGHGISNDLAIKAMVLKTKSVIEAKVSEKITEFYK